ncbi:MAG: hypothetical protein M3Q03_00315 [Chloroflexota bacterium]|nr:hypothetical protein [Chloroflexota bacterium]
MPLYVTVSRGARADAATPILASSDRHVVGAVLQTLARLDEWDDECDEANDLAPDPLIEEAANASSN